MRQKATSNPVFLIFLLVKRTGPKRQNKRMSTLVRVLAIFKPFSSPTAKAVHT